MTTDNFSFYLQNRLIQTSQTGGQRYSDTSPFSIPWSIYPFTYLYINPYLQCRPLSFSSQFSLSLSLSLTHTHTHTHWHARTFCLRSKSASLHVHPHSFLSQFSLSHTLACPHFSMHSKRSSFSQSVSMRDYYINDNDCNTKSLTLITTVLSITTLSIKYSYQSLAMAIANYLRLSVVMLNVVVMSVNMLNVMF